MAEPSASQDLGSLVDAVGGLFGTSTSNKGTTTETGTVTSITDANRSQLGSKQLELDPAAIQQIIRDVLGGADGLAAIFGGEQSAGIFNSSVASQAAGDLAAKLVGEIAKITGKEVTKDDTTEKQTRVDTKDLTTINKVKAKDEGVLSGIGDFFGF